PNITISNKKPPEYHGDRVRGRGSLSLAGGGNEAPLLGVQAFQEKDTAAGVQVVSERCSHHTLGGDRSGWLSHILHQNRERSNKGRRRNVQAQVNGSPFDWDPPRQGRTFLSLEERYGLALTLPLPSLRELCKRGEPPDEAPALERMVEQAAPAPVQFTAEQVI